MLCVSDFRLHTIETRTECIHYLRRMLMLMGIRRKINDVSIKPINILFLRNRAWDDGQPFVIFFFFFVFSIVTSPVKWGSINWQKYEAGSKWTSNIFRQKSVQVYHHYFSFWINECSHFGLPRSGAIFHMPFQVVIAVTLEFLFYALSAECKEKSYDDAFISHSKFLIDVAIRRTSVQYSMRCRRWKNSCIRSFCVLRSNSYWACWRVQPHT